MCDNNKYEVVHLRTSKLEELIDITSDVNKVITKSGTQSGLCIVYVPHTTAGTTINEGADPSVRSDMIMALKSLNFEKLPFRHMEGNSPSHMKASLMGISETIFIEKGKLVLGTWQSIYFCEFDGPRSRKIYIKIISD